MTTMNKTKFPTIVTMFYNVRKRENNTSQNARSEQRYLELANEFILKLPYPLVIFLDENDNDNVLNFVTKAREIYKDITYIYKIDFEKTYYYKDVEILSTLKKQYTIHNLNKEKDTNYYIIVNNNKHFCTEKAIELNPFDSSHFVWMDFGINHTAIGTDLVHDWITKVPDKIKQLCINPYLEDGGDKHIFEHIYHHIAGGLFSGSAENILTYGKLYKKKIEQIYSEGWYQIDEAVMTMVVRENPDLFDLYYGDYPSYISNYLEPVHDVYMVARILDKAFHHQNSKLIYHILKYFHVFFEKNFNSQYIDKYLAYHICYDYKENSNYLLEDVIKIINKKILKKDEKIKEILDINKNSLQFYKNKNLILDHKKEYPINI